jgi:hypothetical protein
MLAKTTGGLIKDDHAGIWFADLGDVVKYPERKPFDFRGKVLDV